MPDTPEKSQSSCNSSVMKMCGGRNLPQLDRVQIFALVAGV